MRFLLITLAAMALVACSVVPPYPFVSSGDVEVAAADATEDSQVVPDAGRDAGQDAGVPAVDVRSPEDVPTGPLDVGTCPPGAERVGTTCRCREGWRACSNACVDAMNDPQNCGGCNRACPASQSCVQGVCGCRDNETLCGAICANVRTSPEHCGACGRWCGNPCVNGVCTTPLGCIRSTQCGDQCVELTTDAHCGACDTVCPRGQTCGTVGTGVACVPRCTGTTPDWCEFGWRPEGAILRSDFCTDLATDPSNCGGCRLQRCEGATQCRFGRCVPR